MAIELPFYLAPLLLLLVTPIIVFFFTRHSAAGRFPPGPWALPIIGHLHHLAGALPHRALRDLARRHGPVMALRLGELPVVVASSADAAREVMRTHDAAFASRPLGRMARVWYQGAEGLIFAPYGDAWRQLRRICTLELLSSRRVHSFRPIRDDELRRLLSSVAAAPPAVVNLSKRVSAFVADSAVRAIVGSRLEDGDAYLRFMREALEVLPGMSLPDLFPSSRLAWLVSSRPRWVQNRRVRIREFMDSIIREHQENSLDEDLLDVLLRLQKEAGSQHPLTTENIKTVMLDMFIAGSETSATTFLWAMSELMRNPSVMRKTQDEVRQAFEGRPTVDEDSLTNLHYLHLVIKETLRLHPPAPLLLPRECRIPCKVLGFDVPEGVQVIVNAWAIGRDPAHWDRPDEFVPERFEGSGIGFKGTEFEFIPFGAGRRMCPGIAFGMAHIELALAALLFHFDWELPGGMAPEELDMTEAFGVTAQRKSDLVLVPVQRVPETCVIFLGLFRKRHGGNLRLPPGPWALPVIGHLHHLAGAPPHRALRALARRHGPLIMLRFCELPGRGGLVAVRRLLGPIESAASAGVPINLTGRIKAFVSDSSSVRAIIGNRSEHRDQFLRLVEEALKIIPGLSLPDLFPSSRLALLVSRVPGMIERRRRATLAITDPLVQAHRDKVSDQEDDEDLLDVLLRLQMNMDGQHPLTTANIRSVITDLFFTGSETSATALQWAMAELMRNPRVIRKAQDEVRRALAGHDTMTEDNLATCITCI
ncbi:hypothetical protein PR202_gb06452 [Eleusine coracana subsp. coracana]|uniref:Uncharacterized protein n=1 Tax=Eleusine coracana subsp. coracana TaxID=191504 RepID=A0AAV5E9G3_ELECO|nr:hypothetical protein PR202_gb06452 [Eleusine coracana subsp. coracana]